MKNIWDSQILWLEHMRVAYAIRDVLEFPMLFISLLDTFLSAGRKYKYNEQKRGLRELGTTYKVLRCSEAQLRHLEIRKTCVELF